MRLLVDMSKIFDLSIGKMDHLSNSVILSVCMDCARSVTNILLERFIFALIKAFSFASQEGELPPER